MALAIDGSTPAIATSSSTTVATLTSASFTPPSGALLLVEWVGNSHTGTNPSQPTITDNLGSPLTYTLIDWQSRGNSPTVEGQAAMWWAAVGTSAAMTITTTIQVGTDNEKQQALRITVLTGADTVTPIGAHGKSGSTSAASIAQNYTAQATGGWGFISVADWDSLPAMSAGTGCTLDGSAIIPTNQITYGFVRRTSADDTNGSTNTLNVTIGGTSTHLNWVYAEVKPAAVTASATPAPIVPALLTQPVRPNPPVILRSTLADPPVLTTRPPLVVTQPAPKPVANQGLTWRNTLQDPPVLTTPAPLVVSQPARFTPPNQALLSRSSLVDVAIVTQATPPPLVVTQPEKPRPGTPPTILRNTLADPPVLTTPAPIVVTAPVQPAPIAQPTILRSSLQDFATPQPLVVSQPYKLVAGTPPVILRSSLQDLSTPQPLVSVPPAVKPWNAPPVILRSSLADPVVVTGTATPRPLVISSPTVWPWTYRPLILTGTRCDCTTHRPSTGTTGRPSSGTTARPNAGVTPDPCC